jgi:hypothetical protein
MQENKTMRKRIAILIVIVLVAVPAFAEGTIRAFDPQPDPTATLNRLSSASLHEAEAKPTPDPAQQFQQIMQQLTQGQGQG